MKKQPVLKSLLAAGILLSMSGCSGRTSSGTLTVASAEPLSGYFHPFFSTTVYDQWIGDLVYQSMLGYDAASMQTAVLAQKLPDVSDDGLSVSYTLRPNLTFSDGSVLDGDDVRYTFELLADPAYAGGYLDGEVDCIAGFDEYQNGAAETISGIEVSADKKTVTFRLAYPEIDASQAIGLIPILPDSQFEHQKGDVDAWFNLSWEDLIGSGPYTIRNFDKEDGAQLSRNKEYSGPGNYTVDTIRIVTVPQSEQLEALKEGSVDLLPGCTQPSIVGPASSDAKIRYSSYPRNAQAVVGFNTQNGPTRFKEVRQALAFAFDRQSFVDSYFQWPDEVSESLQNLQPAYVPALFWITDALGPGDIVTGLEPLRGLNTYPYDPDYAGALLDQAGWKKGKDGYRSKGSEKLVIKFLAADQNALLDRLLPELAEAWKKIGVELQTVTIDFSTMISSLDPLSSQESGPWNAFFMGISFDGLSNTEMNLLEGYSGSENSPVLGSRNYARLVDPDLNSLLEKGRTAGSPSDSIAWYLNAMIASADAMAYLPVYSNTAFDLYNQRIQGLETGPVCPWTAALADVTLTD